MRHLNWVCVGGDLAPAWVAGGGFGAGWPSIYSHFFPDCFLNRSPASTVGSRLRQLTVAADRSLGPKPLPSIWMGAAACREALALRAATLRGHLAR